MDYHALTLRFMEAFTSISHQPDHPPLDETTRGERYVLYRLRQDSTLTSGQIAAQMRVSTARVASILNQLEHKGCVLRLPCAQDHRRVELRLTPLGEQLAQRQQELMADRMEGLLRALGDEDAPELVRLIERIRTLHT